MNTFGAMTNAQKTLFANSGCDVIGTVVTSLDLRFESSLCYFVKWFSASSLCCSVTEVAY